MHGFRVVQAGRRPRPTDPAPGPRGGQAERAPGVAPSESDVYDTDLQREHRRRRMELSNDL